MTNGSVSQEMQAHQGHDALQTGPSPLLGAHRFGDGIEFAVWSPSADRVELCLFESPAISTETRRIAMIRQDLGVWTAFVPRLPSAARYGFRAHGPYSPREGLRFNSNKLLLDPYAKLITGQVRYDSSIYGFDQRFVESQDRRAESDSAASTPRSVVVDNSFDWENDAPPRISWSETIIYECHVKGQTALHPDVAPEFRGTYLGLAQPAMIAHLQSLGATAVELLPIQHFIDQPAVVRRGQRNHWGYNTVGYFAPEERYATAPGRQVDEFKTMVRSLHASGVEVILDVAYNHSGEGDELGPTLMFRGLDNAAYYALQPDDPAKYVNVTGCGNTLRASHPMVLRLILDSLRYWVESMHVDGFRFDLASALIRGENGVDLQSPFLAAIEQDPILSRIKMIAEPWDCAPDGYRLGGFPHRWSEWNDRYRDDVRRFWRGDGGQAAKLASRLTGSSDVFGGQERGPLRSVNFVACHDGFTLADLVSFSTKHNENNLEANQDGANDNASYNWGAEGFPEAGRENEEPWSTIMPSRWQAARNLMATLFLSTGVPMIHAGDELFRTQRGNNNAYCQDNDISWISWTLDAPQHRFLDFVRELSAFRKANPFVASRRFLAGSSADPRSTPDVAWFREAGSPMTESDWRDENRRALGILRFERPNMFLLLLNAGAESRTFAMPHGAAKRWSTVLSTTAESPPKPREGIVVVGRHSLLVLAADDATFDRAQGADIVSPSPMV